MTEAVQVKQGWLYTREDKQFAPYTLIENVYTRSGKKYDERVREYVKSLTSYIATEVNTVKQDINNIKNKNTEQDNHISNLQSKLKNVGGEDSDKLFIVDNNNNVIAYFDKDGIHSVDFIDKNNQKISDKIKGLNTNYESLLQIINILENKIQQNFKNFNSDDNDKLFIIDNDNNVIAYFDKDGVHAVNIFGGTNENIYDLNAKISELNQAKLDLNGEITTRTQQYNELSSLINQHSLSIDNILKVFSFDESSENAYYFIDANENVIAYIDKNGIHATNLLLEQTFDDNGQIVNQVSYNVYEFLGQLRDDLDTEIKIDRPKAIEEAVGAEIAIRQQEIEALWKVVGDDDTHKGNETHEHRLDDHVTRIENLEDKVKNVSFIMDFVGSYNTVADRDSNVPNPNKGDVCIIKDTKNGSTQEYVYDGTNWQEFGDTYQESQDINELKIKVAANENDIRGLKSSISNFKDDESEKLFIIDKDENVIAYVDTSGLHTVNLFLDKSLDKNNNLVNKQNYNVYEFLGQLRNDLDSTLPNKVLGWIETERNTQDSITKNIYKILGRESIKDNEKNHEERLSDVEDKIITVSNIMDFVGVYETDAERDLEIPNPNKGDVCVIKNLNDERFNKEYVYDGSSWQELGDVSAESQRIDSLEKIVGKPGSSSNDGNSHETRLNGLSTDVNTNKQSLNTLSGTVNGLNTTVGEHTSQINGLNTTVGGHITQIGSLNTAVNEHTTQIGGLSADVNTNKTKIASLESKVTNGVYIKTDKVIPITIGFNI